MDPYHIGVRQLLYMVASCLVGGGLFALLRNRIPRALASVIGIFFPWVLFVVGILLSAFRAGDVAIPYALLVIALESMYCIFGGVFGVVVVHQFVVRKGKDS